MFAPRSEAEKLYQRLRSRLIRTCETYALTEPGDRIMVAISGGKDSYTLLDLLWSIRATSPFPFEVVAVHLDQQQPGYDGRSLEGWLKAFGAPYEILSEDTYSVVMDLTGGQGTFCAPCSRLRRGILYTTAARLGCNKIALGHHRDDALETFLMNLFYAGKMQAMPAKYRTDDGRFDVIRPLIECGEDDIAQHARNAAYPILPCNLCGSQEGLKREVMNQLLVKLEQDIPDVRRVMLAALRNVVPSHLLDPELSEVWNAHGVRRGQHQPGKPRPEEPVSEPETTVEALSGLIQIT